MTDNAAQLKADSVAKQTTVRGRMDVLSTYATIAAFVRQMATLPGKSRMVLISPGMLDFEMMAKDAESELIELAAQSHVTISTLEAHGLNTAVPDATKRTTGDPRLQAEYLRAETEYDDMSMAARRWNRRDFFSQQQRSGGRIQGCDSGPGVCLSAGTAA